MCAAQQFRVDEVSPSYWRVTFDNGEINLLDPDTVDQLGALVARMGPTENSVRLVPKARTVTVSLARAWRSLVIDPAQVGELGRASRVGIRCRQLIILLGAVDRLMACASFLISSRRQCGCLAVPATADLQDSSAAIWRLLAILERWPRPGGQGNARSAERDSSADLNEAIDGGSSHDGRLASQPVRINIA
jgi:hypothetical protein